MFPLRQGWGTMFVRHRSQAKREAAKGHGLEDIVSNCRIADSWRAEASGVERHAEIYQVIPNWTQYQGKSMSSASA